MHFSHQTSPFMFQSELVNRKTRKVAKKSMRLKWIFFFRWVEKKIYLYIKTNYSFFQSQTCRLKNRKATRANSKTRLKVTTK